MASDAYNGRQPANKENDKHVLGQVVICKNIYIKTEFIRCMERNKNIDLASTALL